MGNAETSKIAILIDELNSTMWDIVNNIEPNIEENRILVSEGNKHLFDAQSSFKDFVKSQK